MTALEAQFRGDSQVCPLGVTALDDHDVVFFFSGTHSCSRLFGLDVASVGDRLDMAMGCGAWLVVARSLWSTRSGCFSLRGLELGNSSLRVFPCADTSNRRNFDRQGSSLSLSLCSSETIISLPDRLVPRVLASLVSRCHLVGSQGPAVKPCFRLLSWVSAASEYLLESNAMDLALTSSPGFFSGSLTWVSFR